MNTIQTAIIAVGIACANLASLAQQPKGSIVPTGKAEDVQAAPKVFQISDLLDVDGEETAVRKELTQKINERLAKRDYSELDKMADDLRNAKAQMASGTWQLLTFYRILCYEWTDTDNVVEEMWKTRLDFLKAWTNAMPNSISARVALARYYKNYAWNARGLGTAGTVTEEGWRLFKERLLQASQTLTEARKLRSKCPVWWDTMQYVALGEGWNFASYDKLFNEAVAFEPAYTYFYNNKVMYLLPRWFGEEGDWQKFASQMADKTGGEAGDILYARIGWRVHERGFYDGFLRDSGYSWPRMKKGLEVIVKQHPHSLTAASELAYLAYQSRDRTCAKLLFERLGKNVDEEVWHGDKPRFLRARTWALSE